MGCCFRGAPAAELCCTGTDDWEAIGRLFTRSPVLGVDGIVVPATGGDDGVAAREGVVKPVCLGAVGGAETSCWGWKGARLTGGGVGVLTGLGVEKGLDATGAPDNCFFLDSHSSRNDPPPPPEAPVAGRGAGALAGIPPPMGERGGILGFAGESSLAKISRSTVARLKPYLVAERRFIASAN